MADIHTTAQVSRYAELAEDVKIGPYTVVEGNAKIGSGTDVKAHVFIGEDTTIGCNNSIYRGDHRFPHPKTLNMMEEEHI